jgi:hypothetical protein
VRIKAPPPPRAPRRASAGPPASPHGTCTAYHRTCYRPLTATESDKGQVLHVTPASGGDLLLVDARTQQMSANLPVTVPRFV